MWQIVRTIELGPAHLPTGATRHWINGALMPTPVGLAVAQDAGTGSFYLLYLDEHGDHMTDTWHETLDDALHQARFEFGVTPEEWELSP